MAETDVAIRENCELSGGEKRCSRRTTGYKDKINIPNGNGNENLLIQLFQVNGVLKNRRILNCHDDIFKKDNFCFEDVKF